MNKQSKIRLWEIDSIRGLAIIGMIIFHVFFILNFFDVVKNDMHKGGWFLLAIFVQLMFLVLVGVSLTLSKSSYEKQFLRGLKVLFMGILVSIITYFFDPVLFVKFGILHLIGLSVIVFSPISGQKYSSLFCGIASLLIWKFISNIAGTSTILYILGFKNPNMYSLDYFPIFPWISVVLFGIFIGNLFRGKITNDKLKTHLAPKMMMPFVFIGQNSLLIYMIHIPIIITTLIVFNIVPIGAFH